jgi:hypothetical protein
MLCAPVALATLAGACGSRFGAAADDDAAVESGLEAGGAEGSTVDVTTDAPDAGPEAGPAVDAGPPCPYDGGCPCQQSSCKATLLGSYAFADLVSTANDAEYLYLGAGVDGLQAISFADGSLTAIYKPAVATNTVRNIVLSKSDFVLIEETNFTYPDIVAVTRASPHARRVIVAQAHFDGSSRAIAANDTRVYWNEIQPTTVKSALLDGGDGRSVDGFADLLVATADALYATNGAVKRYSPDLATLEAVAGPKQGGSLAVDGTSVFWAGQFSDSLYRAPAAFASGAGVAISNATFIYAIRVGDDGFVYFQTDDSIFRCRLPSCEGGPAKLAATPSGTLTAVVGGTAYIVKDAGGTIIVSYIALHD